jgi:phosphoribulokinase
MPDKLMRMSRNLPTQGYRRPTMLGIAGDSASGKTTLTKGLVAALGESRSTAVCADDYHRYDRVERKEMPFTPLHPDCNYIEVMEQHLQLLATGQSILKPVYDHTNGSLVRPVLVEPMDYVIVEGLLPLHTKLAQACFDTTVYLGPPEEIRREWKVLRDTTKRGYEEQQVLDELDRREPESAAYIRPQKSCSDIVMSFGPIEGRIEEPGTPLSVTILLRPTIRHPNFAEILTDLPTRAMHLKLMRDENGRPVDALHIHGYATVEESSLVAKAIWDDLGIDRQMPESLGMIENTRNEPLRLAQLILFYHMIQDRQGT